MFPLSKTLSTTKIIVIEYYTDSVIQKKNKFIGTRVA